MLCLLNKIIPNIEIPKNYNVSAALQKYRVNTYHTYFGLHVD